MLRALRRAGGSVAAVALAASVLAVAPASASASVRTAEQGVTNDEIVIVSMVADLDGLRSKGINLPPKLTTGNLTKRWQAYIDDFGPINGREVRLETVVWDPTDPTTYDKACTEVTQDVKPFVVLNSAGYRDSSIPCITVDGQVPFIGGDPVSTDVLDASGNRLFTLLPPSQVAGKTTADVVADQELVDKSSKLCILSSNGVGIKGAGDQLQSQLEKRGYDVAQKVEINGLSGDVPLQNRESTAAVATFEAAGCDTVFIGVQFTASQGYFQEVKRTNATFENYIVDDAASMCTIFAASRIPAEAAGTPCVTAADTRALPTKDGVKEDSPAEARCREVWDAAFDEETQPGVPSGDVTAGGVTYVEDVDMFYCTIATQVLPAIKKAGKKLTWAKVAKNLEKVKSGDAMYLSDGEGSFSKKKRYYADNVHLVTLNTASAQTPVDANGTFDGCPAPVNCWVPVIVNGQEWFPITTK